MADDVSVFAKRHEEEEFRKEDWQYRIINQAK